MPSLDTSIANAGLPALERAFGATFQDVQWIVLAYLLTITALIVGAGRLGDLTGRRRLFLGGIALFTLASLLCAAAPSIALLVAARAAQGLGAATMMALSIAFVAETVPRESIGSAMGLLGSMSAIGTTLGPSVGGALIATFGWPAMFLVNVPIGVANFAIAWRALPRDVRPAQRSRFDRLGTFVLALALGAYALAMTAGQGRFGVLNVVLIGAALAGFAAFVLVERHVAVPLIRLELFRDGALRAGLTTSMLVSTVMMTTLVVGPFYLTRALGLPIAVAGLALSAGPLSAALTGVPAGRFVDRFGAPAAIVTGLAGIVTGTAALALLPPRFGLAAYVVPLVVMTSGYALFQAANNTAIMTGIPADVRGAASGLLTLSRNLGLITGAAGMGAIFALAAGGTTAAPGAVSTGLRVTFAVAALLIGGALTIAVAARRAAALPKERSAA